MHYDELVGPSSIILKIEFLSFLMVCKHLTSFFLEKLRVPYNMNKNVTSSSNVTETEKQSFSINHMS